MLAVADQVKRALAETSGTVTDVGSRQGAGVRGADDPRFVGGHPMAGSELDGLDGADGDLFNGAVWVLTPVRTATTHVAQVTSVVASLGAEVVALTPERTTRSSPSSATSRTSTAATLMQLAPTGPKSTPRCCGSRPAASAT